MHKSFEELEFRTDPTTDYRITYPLASEKSLLRTLQCLSFLIESSSFLQATRTTVKSRMSSNFSQIQPWTMELAALERLKKIPID